MGIENIDALVNASVAESHDEEDVPAALERTTDDGPGFAGDLSNLEQHLPPSDFDEEFGPDHYQGGYDRTEDLDWTSEGDG